MTALFRAELARALSRRFVRVLIGLALVASMFAGVLVFLNTAKFDAPARERARTQREVDVTRCSVELPESSCRQEIFPLAHYDKSVYLTDLWPTQAASDDGREPILPIAIVFLILGALLAAASVVGAEWRSGMLGTLLTWEPRRVRVAVARVLTAALAAAVLALVLQVVFIAALLPSMLLHGGTAGADAEWLWNLIGFMGKGAVLTGLAATVGASLAMIGRNTAVALGVAFVYLNILESAVRTLRPSLGRWLIGDNAVAFLGGTHSDVAASPFPALTLVVYALGLLALATAIFHHRDVAA